MRSLVMVALMLLSAACKPAPEAGTDMSNRERAEVTIGKAVEARGARFGELSDSNMAAFGPLAYSYDPATERIVVSVLVAEFSAWTVFPDRRPKIEATLAALEDPAVGGLFDTAGGTWHLDRDTGKLRLQIAHADLDDVSELLASTEALQGVYPEWSLSWAGEVGKIVHNGAPLPPNRVTVKNNPYR